MEEVQKNNKNTKNTQNTQKKVSFGPSTSPPSFCPIPHTYPSLSHVSPTPPLRIHEISPKQTFYQPRICFLFRSCVSPPRVNSGTHAGALPGPLTNELTLFLLHIHTPCGNSREHGGALSDSLTDETNELNHAVSSHASVFFLVFFFSGNTGALPLVGGGGGHVPTAAGVALAVGIPWEEEARRGGEGRDACMNSYLS